MWKDDDVRKSVSLLNIGETVVWSKPQAEVFVTLFIFTDLKEAVVTELQEGDLFFSVTSYVSENEESIDLVEGERVYVLGRYILLNLTVIYNRITLCIECTNRYLDILLFYETWSFIALFTKYAQF